jgi:hypothetical protein
MSVLKAVQLTASGFVTQQRAMFRQCFIFHPIANDSVFEFYDQATVPEEGDPHYTFSMYGKGRDVITLVDPGVLFDDGIYVVVPSGCQVTVVYEEV